MQRRLSTRIQSIHSSKRPGNVFNTQLKYDVHRLAALDSLHQIKYSMYYDYPIMNLLAKLQGIRKEFHRIAFIGPNPLFFLGNLPSHRMAQTQEFTVINPSSQALQKIQKQCRAVDIDKPAQIQYFQTDLQSETDWGRQFDLVVNNMNLHWTNNIEHALNLINNALTPDGALLLATVGEDSLQQLRISLQLAQSEREGGLSQNISPMASLSDIGNLVSRCSYTMPAIEKHKTQYLFPSFFQLLDFLKQIGEGNALHSRKITKSKETFIAAAAIYHSLFNKNFIGIQDDLIEEGSTVVMDEWVSDLSWCQHKEKPPIVATIDYLYLIGWKYHDAQQTPLKRGSAEMTVEDMAREMDRYKEVDHKIQYYSIQETDKGAEIIDEFTLQKDKKN